MKIKKLLATDICVFERTPNYHGDIGIDFMPVGLRSIRVTIWVSQEKWKTDPQSILKQAAFRLESRLETLLENFEPFIVGVPKEQRIGFWNFMRRYRALKKDGGSR